MGLEIEFPCAIHRVAAGPSGPLLVQLDNWIMAVEPTGKKWVQAWRNGGETLMAPAPDGRALVMSQDRRVVLCELGKGVTASSPALCRLTDLVDGEACFLGARLVMGGASLVVLLGVTEPRAETNVKCEVRAVIVGIKDGAARVLDSLGTRVPRLWGVDEKAGVVLAGSLREDRDCAWVRMESGERRPDVPWLGAEERARVVCGDCTSGGRWCLCLETDPDPDQPDAPPARELCILSTLGKAPEQRLNLEAQVGEVRAMSWSPDGGAVAVRTDGQMYLYRPGAKALESVCAAGPMSEAIWWPAAGGIAVATGRLLSVSP
jgi:hypothetical protein